MKNRSSFIFVSVFFAAYLLASCASTPELGFFSMGPDYDNGRLTYFPPARWNSTEGVYCLVDINHRSVPGMPVLCAISVVRKKNAPRGITAIYFQNSQGRAFVLTDVKGVLAEPKNNLVRISGSISPEEFDALITSEQLTLTVTMEGVNYTCLPSKEFMELRQQFVNIHYLDAYINTQAVP
jgi:hypothetical protein